MRIKIVRFFCIGVLLSLLVGCSTGQPNAVQGQQEANSNKPTEHVQNLINQFKLEDTNFEYVKKRVASGTRVGAEAVLVDARPHLKYLVGTIPSSINIPDTQINDYIWQMENVEKDTEIIVFCGGWDCEKSPIVANYLKSIGFLNVKLYQAGEPEWAKNSYLEVGTPVVQNAFKNNSALLIDSRPYPKSLSESIPGALYINDDDLEKLSGRFPMDKKTPIITFCSGYECHKSHVVANKLLELGYEKVSVYAAGLPAWKKEGLPTTAGSKVPFDVTQKVREDIYIGVIKTGVDDGSVDGEWFKELVVADKVPSEILIVDVRTSSEYSKGHFKNAINLEVAKMTVDEILKKLPEDRVIVFYCSTGGRAMEAKMKLSSQTKIEQDKIFYFDANIKCNKENICEIEVNEPLG